MPGFLDDLVRGIQGIYNAAGTRLLWRTQLQFTGDGVAVADDPDNKRTVVTIAGGGGGGSAYDRDFVQGDLVSSVLTVTHNLNRKAPKVSIVDASGNQFALAHTRVSANQITIDFTGLAPLTGTWSLSVS